MNGFLMFSWDDGIGSLYDAYGHHVENRSGSRQAALDACRELFRRRYPGFYSDEIRTAGPHR